MPIKPPNLDDRRYADIVAEARALIPQYCPEWTNLTDADPGMTMVQLFAWMTELTIYRLNKVPDKTYIHFLNFIGEERRRALPASAPLTFSLRSGRSVELPPFARCATRQREDRPALEFLTVDGLTIHDAEVTRVMAVKGGKRPAVRELPYGHQDGHHSALTFGSGRGAQFFELDPADYGPDAYTPYQYLYVAHDDLRLMDMALDDEERRPGRMRIRRTSGDRLSVVPFFRWEYPTAEGWKPIDLQREDEENLGLPEDSLVTAMPGILPLAQFGKAGQEFDKPEPVARSDWWIRGRLDYERWLSARMQDDLEVTWKDDRGGEDRSIHNWRVRSVGRTLEFFLQDLPPLRGGWTIRLALVDRGVPAGRNSYLPRYRWYYRRGETWEEIPRERVRTEGTMVVITGPLTDMATDGFNLRAERIEVAYVQGLIPELELELDWVRPVEVALYAGDDPRRVERQLIDEAPWSPFQISPLIAPTIGRRLYIGSDLFENRRQAPVLVELEIGFEMNGELVEEKKDLYSMQLTYRAEDNWRVVWSEDKLFADFTFSDLDPDGAKRKAKRKIRLTLDPKTQLKGLARHKVSDTETTWLRLELTKSNLTGVDKDKNEHPIVPRIYSIRLGADNTLGDDTYEQPMPGPRMAQLDFREENRRLTRVVTRATGRLSEHFPFFPFVEIAEENQSLYLQLDKNLPVGARHAIQFRLRGESFLPEGAGMEWELLEARDHGRTGWRRVQHIQREEDGLEEKPPYDLTRSGVLEFSLPEQVELSEHGFWLRGRYTLPEGQSIADLPPLPPVTHVLLNTVDAVNLHTMRTERYSGHGVPNQTVQLLRRPLFLHQGEQGRSLFPRPDAFPDIRVFVETDDGEQEEWLPARDGTLLTASKDDRVFIVDPVDGTLTFGNGIRGRMLPVGSNNVLVDIYRMVPGTRGNLGPGEIVVSEGFGDSIAVTNLLPSIGGRDAESIDEIVRRAPSILTSRDRAVTKADFEIIAAEASGEVARAACTGRMDDDGQVEVVILPRRREDERVPDPFLGAGLRDHVSRYLKRRCLINVDPVVRLAKFLPIDLSVTLRLRPNANIVQVREAAQAWVLSFLDPYEGGLDGEGWPFGGTLYAQDFARLVSDIAEVRHVVDVQLHDMRAADLERGVPGWEEGEGDPELVLDDHDLFMVRRVRITTEDGLR
ncbi:MAG: baseplate J/gp47 family protein [Alphaproteobacteria bacterium]|nr:baseplate J/gp47 family protein [Alphaproteobacteria bacterium]